MEGASGESNSNYDPPAGDQKSAANRHARKQGIVNTTISGMASWTFAWKYGPWAVARERNCDLPRRR
jgi:hypothetical protein